MARSGAARPELPGFTYDEKRGRYVKILANHHAGVLGGAAIAASVSAVKDGVAYKKRRRNEEKQLASASKLQIQKSRIHRHAIIGMSLDRQTGLQKHSPDIYGKTWTHLIDPGWTAPINHASSWHMMKKTVQDDVFVGVLYDSGTLSSASSKLEIIFNESPHPTSKYHHTEASFGRVSSLNLIEKYAFITTFNRDEPNRLFEIPMKIPEKSDTPGKSYSIAKTNNQHDYWCTSFHPDASDPKIAVGSEHCILVHNPFCSHGHGLRTIKTSTTSSPVLSIQWKSENVIAAGFRDATVHLYDVRARDDVFRLRHSQSVMRLHCPDENKLLLGGPRQLSMYDLRYNKSPHAQRPSRPWLHYRNYDNTRWNACDMDVSPRLGLLALALEANTEIWNLWTGTRLRQLHSPSILPNTIEKHNVVSFIRPHHRPQFLAEESDPEGLLVVGPNSAQEWRLDTETSDIPKNLSFTF